jgi:phosphate transport system substrate-binding protein
LGGKAQEDLKGIAVFGDPGLLSAVVKDKYAIGFNNIGFAYNLKTKKLNAGVGIVPIDINNNNVIDENEKVYDNLGTLMKAIANGTYPSPPARQLFFVSKNSPDKLTKAFLTWVLNDGQKYVNQMGYVKLNTKDITKSKTNLTLK